MATWTIDFKRDWFLKYRNSSHHRYRYQANCYSDQVEYRNQYPEGKANDSDDNFQHPLIVIYRKERLEFDSSQR